MQKTIIITILIFAFMTNALCQTADSTEIIKPEPLPSWTLLIPGASYYYQNKYVEGTIFALLTTGGAYLGIKYDDNLKSNSHSPYYNYPLFLGLQTYQTEKLAHFKNFLEVIQYNQPGFKYHDISMKDLYLAPFRRENIFTPITAGMALLAGVYLGIEKYNETRKFSDVEEMYFLNKYIPRNNGLGVFSATSLGMSWSAGVGEEYIFRNFFMPMLDFKLGQKKGLIYSSVTFGVLHFQNLLFAENPDFKSTLLQVGNATVLGYFLGRDVQRRGYNIGPAVAAHMWYNTILMIGSFLINPEENVFGINVTFDIN